MERKEQKDKGRFQRIGCRIWIAQRGERKRGGWTWESSVGVGRKTKDELEWETRAHD